MKERICWWHPEVGEAEKGLVGEVLDSNYINEGEYTEKFESEIAHLLNVKFAVATTSGTSALVLALKSLGVGPGDEVLVPDITFIATANAVSLTGAKPVLVDIDSDSINIDPECITKKMSTRTKAVVPVHVSGRGAQMDEILKIAHKHGLFVVEDAAEALLSKYQGNYLGTIGNVGCFSFSPNKTITTGQGGMIVTNDESVYWKLKELKDQGRPVRGTGGDDVHHSVGYNFKMTNMQAAVGLVQLEKLEQRSARLKEIYRRYNSVLEGISQIKLLGFSTEESPQWVDARAKRRDQLDQHLKEKGIDCRRFWFPLHRQKPYEAADSEYPVATKIAPELIWLPSSFSLTNEQIIKVGDTIKSFYGNNS